MSLTKKRWWILFASCLINLCVGSIYAWSVFALGMSEHFSLLYGREISVADLAIVYTVATSIGPVTMISGGWFNDKFGPKKLVLVGGIMFGLGMFLSGFATSIFSLLLSYGILAGLGLGMVYGTTISTAVKFFPDKKGMAGGIITAFYGLSSVILPPIITILIEKYNITFTFKLVGIIFLVVVSIASFFLETCPADFVPEGYVASVTNGTNVEGKDWKQMLASKEFYFMITLLMLGAFAGMMVISQASGIARNLVGMDKMMAATAVSVLALFNVCGRVLAGSISDKLGRINTLRIASVIAIVGLFILHTAGEGTVLLFYFGVALVGICFGSYMAIFPGFTAEAFGPKNNSVNYGIMFIGLALAAYFGPSVMKMVYASTNNYDVAFVIAIVLNIFAIVLGFLLKIMTSKKK